VTSLEISGVMEKFNFVRVLQEFSVSGVRAHRGCREDVDLFERVVG
jgi:hypothetical protein